MLTICRVQLKPTATRAVVPAASTSTFGPVLDRSIAAARNSAASSACPVAADDEEPMCTYALSEHDPTQVPV